MDLNTYKVIMLGLTGSGKTVYLASLYKMLSTSGKLGFYLDVDDDKRKILTDLYTKIAINDDWPVGTKYNEVSEWNFTCRVQTKQLANYAACNFTYLDYAGARLTEHYGDQENPEILSDLEKEFREADALLGLLDGSKIVSFMRNERMGNIWAIKEFPTMLNIMQNNVKPIHFVISKWDVVEEKYSLEEIKKRLIEIDEFCNIVRGRNNANSPVRLIPVSSVGRGFANPDPNNNMIMKKTGKLPKPFQVEIPLACVLPDIIKAKLQELLEVKEKEEQEKVEVQPYLSFWERAGKYFSNSLRVLKGYLPKKYQFADEILASLIKYSEASANLKQEAAKQRTEELIRQKVDSLKKVYSEETALNHAINCFIAIENELDVNFPESGINLL